MVSDIYKRYFIFSREQQKKRIEIETKLGKSTVFGTVIVNGSSKIYTDIVLNMDDCRHADSILVIMGDVRKLKYTDPSK